MNRILVTGGAGFIGSHLVDALVKQGKKVVVYDNLDRQVHGGQLPPYLNLKATFLRADVRNRRALREAVAQADAVVHLAAAVGVGQSQYRIAHYVDANIRGTATLLDILANERHSVRKLVVASSMSIYGEGMYTCAACGDVKPPLRDFSGKETGARTRWEPVCPRCGRDLAPAPTPEETPLVCNSIYAVCKKEQEEMSLLIGNTYGIPVVALRFFNVYGPRQALSNPYTGVAAIFLSRIKNNRQPVVYEDGRQTRDFIWVGDVVSAILLVLADSRADGRAFNVGTGKPVAIAEVARMLARALGTPVEPNVTYRFRKGDIRHCYADTRAIRRLGFSPKVSFEEGIRALIAWARTAPARDAFARAEKELRDKGLV